MKTYLIAFLILSLGMTTHQLNKEPKKVEVEDMLKEEIEQAKIEHEKNQVVLEESQKYTKAKIDKTKEQLEMEKGKSTSIMKRMTLFQKIVSVVRNREEDSLYHEFLEERRKKSLTCDTNAIDTIQ
jgi:uncharacterized protein (UPF0128 family)